jgi:hypothetical protein
MMMVSWGKKTGDSTRSKGPSEGVCLVLNEAQGINLECEGVEFGGEENEDQKFA